MSTRTRRLILIIGLLSVLLSSLTAVEAATNAYDAKYVTSISYMNVGTVPANLNVTFYAATGTSVDYQLLDANGGARVIPPNASASLTVSTVADLASANSYSAVVTANQPLIATVMQVANDNIIGTTPISNAFRTADTSTNVVLPAVMKNCFADVLTTKFAIQNASGASLSDVTYTLKWANGDDAFTSSALTIPAGGVKYVDMDSITVGSVPTGVTLPTGCAFSGAAVVNSAGALAVTVVELSNVNKYANSYEGLPGTTSDGALTLYMPSAMCRVNYGDGEQTSTYAVQNLTGSTADVDVTYKYQIKTGTTLGTMQTDTMSIQVPAYGKVSLSGCNASKNAMGNADTATGEAMPPSSVGSAVITSNRKIVALQKVNGGGLSTATPGIIAGGSTVYAPFVRYSANCYVASPTAAVCRGESRQRTFFAVQNIGATPAKVRAKFYNYLGEEVATFTTASTVAAGAKVSIDPSKATLAAGRSAGELNEFGYTVVSGTVVYSGSAVFESLDSGLTTPTSTIAVVARVMSMTPLGQVGDDYNGTPQ